MKAFKQFVTVATLSALSFSGFAKSEPKLAHLEDAKNLSQALRSNAPFFWYRAKEDKNSPLKKYADHEGWVLGDPHLGNFHVIPLKGEFQWVNIDFDDAGIAPFVYDFGGMMANIIAINEKVDEGDVVAAYITGLEQKPMAAPKYIAELMDIENREFEKEVEEYLEKHIERDKKKDTVKFKHFEREVEPVSRSTDKQVERFEKFKDAIESEMRKLTIRGKVIDIAKLITSRGGNVDALRFWILVENGNDLSLMELKEITEPGIATYKAQVNDAKRMETAKEMFWPKDAQDKHHDAIKIKVDGLKAENFWLRPKKLTRFDVPYDQKSKKELKQLEALAIWDAYHQGFIHGRQKSAKAYLAQIQKDPKEFKEDVKKFAREYIKIVEEARKKVQ